MGGVSRCFCGPVPMRKQQRAGLRYKQVRIKSLMCRTAERMLSKVMWKIESNAAFPQTSWDRSTLSKLRVDAALSSLSALIDSESRLSSMLSNHDGCYTLCCHHKVRQA